MAYSIDKTKHGVKDISKRIESKKSELSGLEKNKKALLEAGREIQGANLDANIVKTVMDAINSELDNNAKRGKELSSEMNSDLSSLEDMKENTQDSIEENSKKQKSLEGKQKLLDKFGLGKKLEKGISDLEGNRKELSDVNKEIIDAQKKLSDTAAKLGRL